MNSVFYIIQIHLEHISLGLLQTILVTKQGNLYIKILSLKLDYILSTIEFKVIINLYIKSKMFV